MAGDGDVELLSLEELERLDKEERVLPPSVTDREIVDGKLQLRHPDWVHCPNCFRHQPPEIHFNTRPPPDEAQWPEPFENLCYECRAGETEVVEYDVSLDRVRSMHHRKIIAMHLAGAPQTKIAEATGLSRDTIARILSGESHPEVRAVLRQVMRARGFDELSVLQGLEEARRATKPMWNRETNSWDHFPDNSVRLKAANDQAAILGVKTVTAESGKGAGAPQVHLHLGFDNAEDADQTHRGPDNAIVIGGDPDA